MRAVIRLTRQTAAGYAGLLLEILTFLLFFGPEWLSVPAGLEISALESALLAAVVFLWWPLPLLFPLILRRLATFAQEHAYDLTVVLHSAAGAVIGYAVPVLILAAAYARAAAERGADRPALEPVLTGLTALRLAGLIGGTLIGLVAGNAAAACDRLPGATRITMKVVLYGLTAAAGLVASRELLVSFGP